MNIFFVANFRFYFINLFSRNSANYSKCKFTELHTDCTLTKFSKLSFACRDTHYVTV